MNIKKLKNVLKKSLVAAENSHDSQTQVGSVLVTKETNATMADGFNGFVRGAPDGVLPTTRPEKYDYMIHAEENIICHCARHGIKTDGCFIVNTLSPCKRCIRLCWQAGIDTVYFPSDNLYGDFEQSLNMGDLNIKIDKIGTEFIKLTLSSKVEK